MTLVEELQDKIKKKILNHEYDENGYLPSEGEFCKMYSVSRATVREAIRSLEVRGFVERIHGKGIKVIDNGINVMTRSMMDMFDKSSITLDDVLEVRWTIETKAAALAAERATEEDIVELKKCVEKMNNSQSIDEEYLISDLKFHQILVAASKNKMLESITCAYSKWLKNSINVSSRTEENLERKYQYHDCILQAIIEHDSVKAKENMRKHLSATYKNKNSKK